MTRRESHFWRKKGNKQREKLQDDHLSKFKYNAWLLYEVKPETNITKYLVIYSSSVEPSFAVFSSVKCISSKIAYSGKMSQKNRFKIRHHFRNNGEL